MSIDHFLLDCLHMRYRGASIAYCMLWVCPSLQLTSIASLVPRVTAYLKGLLKMFGCCVLI